MNLLCLEIKGGDKDYLAVREVGFNAVVEACDEFQRPRSHILGVVAVVGAKGHYEHLRPLVVNLLHQRRLVDVGVESGSPDADTVEIHLRTFVMEDAFKFLGVCL